MSVRYFYLLNFNDGYTHYILESDTNKKYLVYSPQWPQFRHFENQCSFTKISLKEILELLVAHKGNQHLIQNSLKL